MDQEQQPQKKSYRMVWIAVALFALFLVVLVGSIFLVMQTSPKQATTTTSKTTSPTPTVASKETVKKQVDDATAKLKKAASDQAAVKAAIDDSKNQIKVGN